MNIDQNMYNIIELGSEKISIKTNGGVIISAVAINMK
jgi:hypothetical protein